MRKKPQPNKKNTKTQILSPIAWHVSTTLFKKIYFLKNLQKSDLLKIIFLPPSPLPLLFCLMYLYDIFKSKTIRPQSAAVL